MPNVVVFIALSVQCLLVVGSVRGGIEPPTGSFVRVTDTVEGRRQTVLSWGGSFLAVEDAVVSYSPGQLYTRQMTNGHDVLLLIFKGRGNLVACELTQGDSVEVEQFRRGHCNGTGREEDDGLGFWRVLDRHPEIDKTLVDWETSRRSCVRLQAAKRLEAHMKQRFMEYEEKRRIGHEENEVKVVSRPRRAISLMWPGTTWCGVGNVSRDNAETEGAHVETDKCCRQHDLCNFTIGSFSNKYNLINFRFHTISHCECDDRFRTCLRMASNDHSDTVGRLFFNILGMKCFVFEKENVCLQRAWWGGCTLKGYQLSAVLRDSVPYYEE